MSEQYTLESLKNAIGKRQVDDESVEEERFERVAQRYEQSVHALIDGIKKIVDQIPDFEVSLEDETEVFTTPAYPGYKREIEQRRLRVALDEDFVLFDPTARAFVSAHGQVEIVASKPLTYMIEKVLYLVDDPQKPNGLYWGYRSVENLSGQPVRFTKEGLLRLLHTVFAG